MNTVYMETPLSEQLHICVLPPNEARNTMWFYVNRPIHEVAILSSLIKSQSDGIDMSYGRVMTSQTYAIMEPQGAMLEEGGCAMELRVIAGYNVTMAIYDFATVMAKLFRVDQAKTFVGYYGQECPRSLSEMLNEDMKSMVSIAASGAVADLSDFFEAVATQPGDMFAESLVMTR